jgi:CubicO group peptidase (beta-lactamase class C family)
MRSRALSYVVSVLERRTPFPAMQKLREETGLDRHDPWSGEDVLARLAEFRDAARWIMVGEGYHAARRRHRALLRGADAGHHLVVSLAFDELERARATADLELVTAPLTSWDSVVPRTERMQGRLDLHRLVAALRERERVPGAALVAARDDVILHHSSIGAASIGGAPVHRRTAIRGGSLAKVVTALAIVRLVRAGVLRLDDPIGPLLAAGALDERDSVTPITIRHLLTHTSGLPRSVRAGMTPAISGRPGATRSYSNVGYELLALAIARVTGTPFARWIGDEVFVPLGMADSRIEPYAAGLFGYDRLLDWVWPATQPRLGEGSRGLTTTACDLALLGAEVLRAPELTEQQLVGGVRDAERGLGMFLGHLGGRPIAFHVGGVRGSWQSCLMIDQKTRFVVAAVANSHPVDLRSLAEAVLDKAATV